MKEKKEEENYDFIGLQEKIQHQTLNSIRSAVIKHKVKLTLRERLARRKENNQNKGTRNDKVEMTRLSENIKSRSRVQSHQIMAQP